ncbi:hypothetical protein MTYP_01052 [Methylophilaceae bacterium]|nr:hypothetical protein MTYP_01052 [Methylophilaceae bacterium]
MALSTNDYLQQLRGLLPPGPAWPRDADSLLTKLLTAIAEEFARVDNRIDDLIDEADPRTTLEMLADWERLCGLPDTCTGPLVGLQARRDAVVARLTMLGGQSAAFYKALAASIGYDIEVTEETVHTCLSDCMAPVNGQPWRFVWNVTVAQADTPRILTCMDECTTPLQVWGDELLECVINRVKPAHTLVRFIYL